ncbi:MAG: arylesterase [Verrucomicrobiales bacterium]|nr:arylesterase [Verrucomicrobiales bacterium]
MLARLHSSIPSFIAWLALIAACVEGVTAADGDSKPAKQRVLILGDSITAGYGVDAAEGYPSLLQQKIDQAQLPYVVVNAGVSGDTTSGGLRRVDWILRQPVDVFVLALGGNDGLRGIAPSITRSNLTAILERVHARYPKARLLLAGMQMPPNMGKDYTEAFQALFPQVAKQQQAALIPFLLEGIGGKPEFNQPDLIHPTPVGHQKIAENVWQVLKPILTER